ncbi:hypothetical protein [Thalassococcus lentus]|uniref:Tetratricopeptide repeat-containing protein n=1 Tax=Thalassococcus lentus TaxID=1210524 RepID=A0ABT4XPF0_9RHOB|nr:hypothetical protein [Thalassococcus lentus]MDA7423824.1 hypothetical protein [Thalassococcus lentus]
MRPDKAAPVIRLGQTQEKKDLAAALRTYERGRAKFPTDEQLKGLISAARLKMGFDGAEIDLDAELTNPTQIEQVLRAALNQRIAALSETEIVEYNRRIAEVFPLDRTRVAYAQALVSARKFETAARVFDEVSNQGSARVLLGQAVCAGAMEDYAKAEAFLRQHMETGEGEHAFLRAAAAFLDSSPDLKPAIHVLEGLDFSGDNSAIGNLIEFASRIMPPRRALLKGGILDSEVRLSEAGQSGAAVLAFAGFARRTGAMPFSMIDRFFAGYGVSTGSFYDSRAKLFWDGLDTLGGTLDASISGLRQRLDANNLDRVYTIGTSGGGVGAIVWGCELEARRVLSFSGPTDIRIEFLKQNDDARGQAAIHALNKRLDDSQLNLRAWLEARHKRSPIRMIFCENEPLDAVQANNIAHLPEVSLCPVARYAEHESVSSALGTGDLLREFDSILEDVHHG